MGYTRRTKLVKKATGINAESPDKNPASSGIHLSPHSVTAEEQLSLLNTTPHGLSKPEVEARLKQYGGNIFPHSKPPGISKVFFNQFISPLIYVLLAAAVFSIFIKEWSDAGFISAVLIINAIIGTIQEYSAQRVASALNKLVHTHCQVLREGDTYEINANELVPGDIVLIESGEKIPADIRLLDSHDLEIDESLLTGESLAVLKDARKILDDDTILADRENMVFTGTLVNRGRGRGVVVTTALETELGHIAEAVLSKPETKTPLLIRMEEFTHRVAIFIGIAALLMAIISLARGMPLAEILLLSVALAVSAIPEGLPVAMTVALAIGMRRMAKRNVIIRRLLSVEALGSCTFIATDKTGTLTVNQLTVRRIILPPSNILDVTGEGMKPEGKINIPAPDNPEQEQMLERLLQAVVLNNEGFIGMRDNEWMHHGDAVDVALLVLAHKANIIKAETTSLYPEITNIPFESERLFSATLNKAGNIPVAFVKGALEKLLPMCSTMSDGNDNVPLDRKSIEANANLLANQGYRVMAVVSGITELQHDEVFSEEHLKGMTFLGLTGMIDPIRHEARDAITACLKAGIDVAMITGDHPATALAIARELNLADESSKIVTGAALRHTKNTNELDNLIQDTTVFARVEPRQKLEIVQSLQRQGHFVAVSGDGANDAPALRAAQVGVAMGKSGTDVARETAGLIITDDNFASIVAGIEEGRVAYSNVRKVIFLLISTGAAELVLFTLALLTGQALPLLAVQLLWLNLVTNGIQDIALAFEPAEGNELNHPPRSPDEPIFNRLMIERVIVSALTMGILTFALFQLLMKQGYSIDEARNGALLLMVLFENIHVFNSRSETLSVFRHNPFRNPLLLLGTITAQLVHIGAMYTPWISNILHIQPVSLIHWGKLLFLALFILLVMELHKKYWQKRSSHSA